MLEASTDRIEQSIVLHAPHARVWRAISDADEFCSWFRARLEAPFVLGVPVCGRHAHPGCERLEFDVTLERLEAQKLVSMRWHPHPVKSNPEYSQEPTTQVEFRLADVEGGTELTVIESGFDQLPPEQRETSVRKNASGWLQQLQNVKEHVDG